MATAFIGNLLNSNIKTLISSSTSTGQTSGQNQVLPSNILANTTLGSGNYTYQWSQSGTSITFSASTSNSTNCTYNSLTVAGSTTIYCTVSDTWTGVQVITGNCVITWPIQATVPGAPTIGASSSGNQTFTINWTAPASDGGSAITGYYVRNSTDNGANWSVPILVGLVLTYQWTGLTNGTSYIGSVAAVNAIGTGSYSANSAAQIPSTTPGAPTIGASTFGDKSYTINWTAGTTGGSAITGYYVRNSTNGGSSWSTPILVGLVATYNWSGNAIIYNGNTYIGQVAAVNVRGTGSYSGSATGRIPTFAAPSCSVTIQAGYPTQSDPNRRPITITINPTACVNYNYTGVWIFSSPYEDFGAYSGYVKTYSGGPGTLNITVSSAGGQTVNVYSIYQQNAFLGSQYYDTGANIIYYVYVSTFNNDNYGVQSSTVNYTTPALVPYYVESIFATTSQTFLVTGNTYQVIGAYTIPNNDTNVTGIRIYAASTGTVTICTTSRYFNFYWSGTSTSTYPYSQTGLIMPFTNNSGTTYRNLFWDVVDTGYNVAGAGKIRVNGAGSIGTWATNQRTNVYCVFSGFTRTLNYY